jgi:hypothetical protein
VLAGGLRSAGHGEPDRRAGEGVGELPVACRPWLDDIHRCRQLALRTKVAESVGDLWITKSPACGFVKIDQPPDWRGACGEFGGERGRVHTQ